MRVRDHTHCFATLVLVVRLACSCVRAWNVIVGVWSGVAVVWLSRGCGCRVWARAFLRIRWCLIGMLVLALLLIGCLSKGVLLLCGCRLSNVGLLC